RIADSGKISNSPQQVASPPAGKKDRARKGSALFRSGLRHSTSAQASPRRRSRATQKVAFRVDQVLRSHRARKCGYESAATVRHSVVADNLDAFRIPRMGLAPMDSFADFVGMLRGDLDYLLVVRKVRQILGLV